MIGNTKVNVSKYKTNNGFNVTAIKTDKFKTNSISLFIHNQLDQATVTQNALIPMILRRGSKDYPTMQELSKRLEELYGSAFGCGVVKKGERQVMHFYIDGINDNYLQTGEKLFDSCAEVLNSIVANPLVQAGKFNDEYVRQEKENLAKLIESRINDKTQYAVERCYKLMCSDESYGIHELGRVEDIEKIENAGLTSYYTNIINTAKMDLMVLGDIDDEWISRLGRIIKVETNNSNKILKEDIYKNVKDIRTYTEEMDVNQGKLSMGFRTNVGPVDPDYYALVIYASILGGGVHSKLFQNVREKASLAYYAFARLEKLKGLMMVGSGIETENYDKAKEIIIEQVNEIKRGNISDFEFGSSIKTLENGLRAMSDEPLQMIDFYLGQSILGTDDDFESVISKIKEVKTEDVVKVAQKVQLDTIHFIKPREGKQ